MRRPHMRWVTGFAALVVMAALAGGTAGASTSREAGGGTVTVHFLGAESPSTFAPVISAFEKLHPNIKVQYESVPFGSLTADIESRVGGHDTSVDIYEADSPNVPYYAARGLLVNVDSYRAQMNAAISKTSIVPVTYLGSIWAFPLWTSDAFLYYSKAELTKAGLSFPSSSPTQRLTWEELASEAITVQHTGITWGISIEQLTAYYQLEPLPASLGGGTGLTGKDLLTPDITTTPWLKSMDWYQSLFSQGITPKGESFGEASELFIDNKVPFFIGGPWDISAFDSQMGKTKYGIAPLPYFAGGRPYTPTDSESFGLSPYSPNPKAALDFLSFMTLTNSGASLASSLSYPVTPVEHAAFTAQLKGFDAEGHSAASAILSYDIARTAIHRPVTVGYVLFESTMDQAFTNISDGANVLKTLNATAAEIRTEFSELGLG